jgi:hypothetical protein
MEFILLLLLAAVVVVRYGSGGRYRPVVDGALGWAVVIGAVSFALGFFGPMMLTPSANQGPMLGIFITGPLGFFVGLLWGAWRSWPRAGTRRDQS